MIKLNRRTAREKALKILFQLDINDNQLKVEIEELLNKKDSTPFLNEIVQGVAGNNKEIDAIIVEHLENWTIDRIASVERTVLRMSIFEIKFLDDIPVSVSINEAIELANKYGDENSGKFVNGVLSKIIN